MSIPKQLGPYRIERLLGQGGMGAVYFGIHCETDQAAAVKTLSAGLSSDEDFRRRFIGEIESLKKLRHPHIVQLFGWGEQDGQLFYAMEFVDGPSLHQQLEARMRFAWPQVLRLAIDIARALKHAHDNGVIHRDLKPANLLMESPDCVKLTDFGIAKLFGQSQLTVEGGVVGTADYMAPEQAHGHTIDNRCDLYSLGTVMWTLLAGRPPFVAKSLPAVVHKVCYEAPPPLRQFAKDVPAALDDLIGELLQKNPADRPRTAVALAKRLEAMQHGLGTAAEGATTPSDADFELSDQDDTAVRRARE
ncbi:MAG: serine/threonine protein kinase, partial [Planctomycetales bacterium]|nr:serine/threonine protein kinase [Planctomycetales bacterium]